MGIHILIVTNPRSGRDFSNRKSCWSSLTIVGTNIQIVYWIPLWRIFTKNGRCHCFGRMTKQNKFKTSQNNNDNSTDNSTTTAQQQQQMIDDHTDVVIFIFLVGPSMRLIISLLFLSSKILTSYDLRCYSVWFQSRITRAWGRGCERLRRCGWGRGSTVSAEIFVCFFVALRILTCYYQRRKQRPWGRTGGAASGKGTCPCSGRCIVVMTARLLWAGNGGDARGIA